jgi:hypothetical protein
MKRDERPAVTVPGRLVGLLDFPAPVYGVELGMLGFAVGPMTPPYEDRAKRIEVYFPSGSILGGISWEELELDLTQEAGVTRALFWLGDRLGIETAEDRKLRSNPPVFLYDEDIGCWAIDEEHFFGPEDNEFLLDCEVSDGPVHPDRFVKDLPAFDADDPYSWHKALRALMLHVEASGVNQAGGAS